MIEEMTSDSSVSGSDIDDISFAPGRRTSTTSMQRRKLLKSDAHGFRERNGDGQALCMDNRIGSGKVAIAATRSSIFHRMARSRFLWPAISVATTTALLICLIAVFARSCDRQRAWEIEKNREAKNRTCIGFPWSEIRLPASLAPVHYDLMIHPNISEQLFEGRVVIYFDVKQTIDVVIFHSKALVINDHDMSLKHRRIKSWRVCESREQVAIFVDRAYAAGENDSLTMSFRGNLSEGLRGLYRSSYRTPDGRRRYVAVTQFEPTDARRMFPCWDEPAFKAYFTLSIVREPKMVSISNMPLLSTVNDSKTGLVIDRYEKSLKMSTYILALVVCDFPRTSTKTRTGNVEISVYAPEAQIHQTQYALTVAKDALEYLEGFFQISYPLKKLDMIALSDFAAGAMENWGLVTFRDNLVLFDPEKSSTQNEEAIATVVTHELGHQWFGNLVTMKWWSDLWLNEGFARFIENFATSRIRPHWNLMSMFVADATTEAMFLDGLNTTHAIFVNVTDPSDIESVFDAITYDKGACVIYMLMTLVGEESLKKGLRDYLSTYHYANAEGDDLWRTLTNYTSNLGGLTLTEVAKSWTTQPGYPMINLTYSNGVIRFEQTRLIFLKEMRVADSKQLWHVPITIVTNLEPRNPKDFWLKEKKSAEFPLPGGFTWLKANVNGTGFYRVLYDSVNWLALSKQLMEDHKVFSASDRTLLLDDAFAFLRAGLLDVDTVFSLLEYFPKEANYGPADIVLGYLSNLDQQLVESELYVPFRKYVRQLLLPLYNRVGWVPPTGHEERLFQARVLGTSCRFDVSDCKAKATGLFWKWQKQGVKVSPDLLGLVCAEAIFNDSGTTWDLLWDLYSNATVPSEKLTYLRSLAYAQQPWRLNQILEMALHPESIRPNLMSMVGAQVAANPVGRLLAWRHVKLHWNDITKLVETTSILGNLIKGTISFYNTLTDYNELVEFFRNKELGGSKAMLHETLELVKINIQWRQLNERALEKWLTKRSFA